MMRRLKKYPIIPIRAALIVVCLLISCETLTSQVVIRPDDRDDYAKQAVIEYENGHMEEGKTIVDEGLKKYPKDADLRMLLGKYYHEKKQYDKARYELNKSLEHDPANVEAKQILVNVETESGRYSSAICFVNELLEVNPYWRGLWRKKIALYELQGNSVEANRLRKRISQIYPEDSQLQIDYAYNTEMEANDLRKAGKIDDAISLSRELVQLAPDNPTHYSTLANDYLKTGDTYNALSSVERGLVLFPDNMELINRKSGILAEQKRYDELLSFLEQKISLSNSVLLRQQYNYYLLEAAQNAKEKDPATLYGKIFEINPDNEEAFSYVFNSAIANQQYEEALSALERSRGVRGDTKELSAKELTVYQRMGNTSRADALAKQLFAQYPEDGDLQEAYVKVLAKEAKEKMADEKYKEAVADWNQVKQYGDEEMYQTAQTAIFNAHVASGDHNNALNALNIIIEENPLNAALYVKRADLYLQQKRYSPALSAYEQAIGMVNEEEKPKYLGGYADMLVLIIKELNDRFRFNESIEYVKRWLEQDPRNMQALQYAVNLSHQRNNREEMRYYAELGNETYPDEVFFKLKLAEIEGLQSENYAEVYEGLHQELLENSYNQNIIHTFAQLSEDYGNHLIKNQQSEAALAVLDTALQYAPNNNPLKYMKGLAYEKLKQYDLAYQNQLFYDPSLIELSEFKQHLNYLKYKGYSNQVGIQHLRSRFGHDYTISSISTIVYSRFEDKDTYIGRFNYAGRSPGKGIQLQAEWSREWNEVTRSKIDVALANKYFPTFAFNASSYRDYALLEGVEIELGGGYRRLFIDSLTNVALNPDMEDPASLGEETKNLLNVVAGMTKEIDPWRLNVRFNNFLLDGKWMYNLSTNVRYYLSSPKNYLMAMGSIGSSPDVDIINYQFYDGFSVLNTMVGAGFGYMLTKTVSLTALGTWYNYKVDSLDPDNLEQKRDPVNYRDLYNIYFTLNVAF